MFRVIVLALFSLPSIADACQPARVNGYDIAEPPAIVPRVGGEVPVAPQFNDVAISRGRLTDADDCSELAHLRLVLTPESSDGASYRLHIVEGRLPFEVPDAYLSPLGLTGSGKVFYFRWNDLEPDQESLEPINAVLAITKISFGGKESTPTLIRLHDGGGEPVDSRTQ